MKIAFSSMNSENAECDFQEDIVLITEVVPMRRDFHASLRGARGGEYILRGRRWGARGGYQSVTCHERRILAARTASEFVLENSPSAGSRPVKAAPRCCQETCIVADEWVSQLRWLADRPRRECITKGCMDAILMNLGLEKTRD